jgi:hypothetical protein
MMIIQRRVQQQMQMEAYMEKQDRREMMEEQYIWMSEAQRMQMMDAQRRHAMAEWMRMADGGSGEAFPHPGMRDPRMEDRRFPERAGGMGFDAWYGPPPGFDDIRPNSPDARTYGSPVSRSGSPSFSPDSRRDRSGNIVYGDWEVEGSDDEK